MINNYFTNKKITYLSFLLLMCSTWAKAQNHDGLYGNEWIDYSRTYYKIQVATDAFYRISSTTLQSAGIPVGSISPSDFQLYRMGQEVALYVHAPGGVLEYIEFYGEQHRGELDKHLYVKEWHHFNQRYSLINDTMAYFLTWSVGQHSHYAEQSANLSNLPPKENYHWAKAEHVFTNQWNPGKKYHIATEKLSKTLFEYGEGFGSTLWNGTSANIATPNAYNSGPTASVTVRIYCSGELTGSTADLHNLQLKLGNNVIGTNQVLEDTVFNWVTSIATSSLGASNNNFAVGTTNANQSDRFAVSHITVDYPRQFNFGGAAVYRFKMSASAQRQYLEITNIDATNAASQSIYLYDLTNRLRIHCFWDGSRVLTDLPASATDRDLVLVNFGNSNAGYRPVVAMEPITFTDYSGYSFVDYLIITHPSLRSDNLGDPVLEYAAFRSSTGFTPHIIDINDLYNQFSYGIEYHPISVRNFSLYITDTWGNGNPRYLFLIGKGRDYEVIRDAIPANLKVPAFGYPCSDQILTARNGSHVPSIPVGRLAATTGAQVRSYLRKMQALEANKLAASTLEDRGWTKNILHLGGGRDSYEQNVIRNNLNNMADIAEQPNFGGYVESFFKTSSNPIQSAQSEHLDSFINNGTSLITFFGHSSANSFDFNLDHPSNYDNDGKYPLVLALGCYGGTISTGGFGISEEFVFEPDAGASVFLASSGAAALPALDLFAKQFYTNMSGTDYGKGAAKMVQTAIAYFENAQILNYSTTLQMVCEFMTYHGDPAFDLNVHSRPDYYIDETLVSHSPSTVTTQMEEFTMNIDIHNIGRAIDTVFWVEIHRQYADGMTNVLVSRQQITAPLNATAIAVTIPVDGGNPNTLGINLFTIEIESDEEINEQPAPNAENNNIVAQYAVHILSDAVLPVYPYEFAIVPEPTVTLKASTGVVFAPSQTYRLQIDTTEYFNSPLFRETTVTQIGGLIEWQTPYSLIDSTVYYWRVSVDSINPAVGFDWAYSSFIYLDGSYPGWNQSHFFQYHKDNFQNVELPEGSRDFKYISSFQEILLRNGFTPNPLLSENLSTYLNGSLMDKCRCPQSNGVYVMVLDSSDLSTWDIPIGGTLHGAVNCSPVFDSRWLLFETRNNPSIQDSLTLFIQNVVPSGFYVLLFTLNDAGANTWNQSLVNILNAQGAQYLSILQSTPGGLPYAFFFQNNTPSFQYTTSVIGATQQDVIELSGLIPGTWYKGYLQSRIIGPALEWRHLYWDYSLLDGIPTDITSVDIYGIDNQGYADLLIDGITNPDTSLLAISANDYPRLQLVWNTADQPERTSPQLDYWRIQANLVPEAALRPEMYLLSQSDTIPRGQDYHFRVAMQNISGVDMDSMLVKFWVLGDSMPQYQRLKPMPAGDTLWAIFSTSTLNRYGHQQLLVEINPNNDQPEQYHFNNVGLYAFFVSEDLVNPVLDVTFDGAHIMNNDIVSGKPEIMISLTDENRYLGLDELEDFTIILRHPSFPNGETALTTTNSDLQFYPANLSSGINRAKIVVHPDLIFDGTYTLFVSAQDRSGNNSGKLDYNVDFEVINKASISNVLNYPNPFTTSTQFVFTLTGRELPDYIKIQIMTINGETVREITKEELGEMRIGINRSEFVWDGTDQYGDRLANGVYFYRVIAVKDGEQYELYGNNQIDHYFQRGFGKMYIMR